MDSSSGHAAMQVENEYSTTDTESNNSLKYSPGNNLDLESRTNDFVSGEHSLKPTSPAKRKESDPVSSLSHSSINLTRRLPKLVSNLVGTPFVKTSRIGKLSTISNYSDYVDENDRNRYNSDISRSVSYKYGFNESRNSEDFSMDSLNKQLHNKSYSSNAQFSLEAESDRHLRIHESEIQVLHNEIVR